MGDSGQGWECMVDIECFDASSEFGDNPGAGEGIVARVGDVAGNVVEAIGNFFKGIFWEEKAKIQVPILLILILYCPKNYLLNFLLSQFFFSP